MIYYPLRLSAESGSEKSFGIVFTVTQLGQIYFTTNELKPDKYLSVKGSAILTFFSKNAGSY
tara:strand:+ start:275 stop:460 length:186 start_codon:yes stop_codon:yes gene_type:complete